VWVILGAAFPGKAQTHNNVTAKTPIAQEKAKLITTNDLSVSLRKNYD